MDFQDQLESLREERDKLKSEIEEIEDALSRKASNTENLRRDLERLTESLETGKVPEEDSETSSAAARIPKVEINPETDRPRRGKRTEQIRKAIQVVSRRSDDETFSAAELFEALQEADSSFEESQRAYLYSKLKDLRDEGYLEKVDRGEWRLAD